jgi:hypothetical protein
MLGYLILFGILILYLIVAYYAMAFVILAGVNLKNTNSITLLALHIFFELIYTGKAFLFCLSILFFIPAFLFFDFITLIS